MSPPHRSRVAGSVSARAAIALGALAALASTAAPVRAQEGCEFGPEGNDVFRRVVVPGGGVITYVTRPHFVCEDGVQVWADSAVAYSELGMSHLIGSVRYRDRTRELSADEARYFTDQGRLQASRRVFLRDESDGSEIRNGDLVYLRRTSFREVEEMTVTTGADSIRPTALVVPAPPDSVRPDAEPPRPYTVVGDRLFLRGDSYFTASGAVEIEQDSLLAFADSAEYDQAADALALAGSARVESGDTDLLGRTITVGTPGADSSVIHARRDALLTAEGLRLTAPQILVFLTDGDPERLVAMPLARGGGAVADSADLATPVAEVDDATLTADSLDIRAPGAVIDRVIAVGRARSVSTAGDSLNVEGTPEVARSDWLRGDTVIVTFRPVATDSVAGGGDRYEIEEVIAVGGATALYRLAPSDSTARAGVDPPALHYVVGDRITIAMVDGDVETMAVQGQTRGAHLEPLPRRTVRDTTAVGRDSVAAPDTAVAVPDTAAARRDTIGARRPGDADGPRRPSPALQEADTPDPRRETPRKEEPWRRE